MANYTSTANVILSVNGKQAQKMLTQLEKEAQRLERQIAKAATAGDKATMKKLQRELNSTKRMMDQLKGSAASVDNVLHCLDKATPKELNRTLKTLQQQLNGIQRGTTAWDAHVAKIQAVKAELQRVNSTMAVTKSAGERALDFFNKWQVAIMGVAAAVTGLIMAGRKAVNAYAEMDESLANTMKFTGMTREQVEDLNDSFKQMDTRTARDTLNDLAQEAGRLGKTSKEDVLGYVQAADIINVALSDLGQGATQSIAKLSNIFKIEDEYGTYDAMVKISSVVNVLSQNCTASKPYLVEFANRLAGVGNQAHISLQNIIGFGAVLDANAQKVEASATAIGQVLTRMYRDPAKYAKVAGLDVQKFSNLLKTDANEALLVFLETLGKAGDMDVLSPMFADMGENGARVITALSTLSKHIDEVRWQQENANRAFDEGTSVLHEYEIFNNTAQAGIDKAKKRISELSIELGEKLMPIMRHVYTSGSLFLRALSALVDFVIKYKGELVSLVAGIALYTLAVKGSAMATAAWSGVCKVAQGVAIMTKIVIMALRVAYYHLTLQTEKAAAMTRLFNTVCKASAVGIVIGLVTALIGILANFIRRTREAKKALEQVRREEEEWKQSLTDISEAAAQAATKEEQRVKSLYNAAIDQAKSTDERRKAAEKLQQLYPDYFKNLSIEQIMVGQAKEQYDKLRDSIINAARARAAAAKIEENEKQLLTLEDQLEKEKKTQQQRQQQYDKAVENKKEAEKKHRPAVSGAALGDSREMNSRETQSHVKVLDKAAESVRNAKSGLNTANNAVSQTQRKINAINSANASLAKKYQIAAGKTAEDTPEPSFPSGGGGSVGGAGSSGGSSSGATKDRFEAEKEWREQMEATARIEYATGVSDYVEYTKEMDRIAVEFCEKQLLHTDLTETERLKITAEWREAQKKQQERFDAQSIEQENVRASEKKALIIQSYIDGEISKETYDIKIEEAEIEHQRKLISATKEGTKERGQAEQQLQSLLISQTQRKQQEREKLESQYASMKKDYFGDNPQEAQKKLDADLALLKVVYDREIAAAGDYAAEKLRIDEAYEKAKLALKKKYGLLSEAETRNAMEKGIADSVEWLNSDGGKAITGTLDTLVSGMSAVFSQLSSLMQADLEMQTAAINRRYDVEISRAEGNSYKVKKLEKEKEKEIAKAKSEANRKMFAMQVIQAVAQTATNALNAYGSAAAVPVVGYILAPIAAAMAVAAGAIQIATIKKQQQASEAQGYMTGGFTPEGKPDEVAGVVHKGEWVASQRLVNNPRTRPLLEALDYAQRTNTIGSITAADVSRTITAPAVLASAQSNPPTIVNNTYSSAPSPDNERMIAVLDRLDERLNEPFVTVNTVTGDHGIQRAQNEYDRLMKNKSPKSKK